MSDIQKHPTIFMTMGSKNRKKNFRFFTMLFLWVNYVIHIVEREEEDLFLLSAGGARSFNLYSFVVTYFFLKKIRNLCHINTSVKYLTRIKNLL